MAWTDSKSLTSVRTTRALVPAARTSSATDLAAASSMSASTTFIPPPARARAMPRPMPLPPPVTTAVFPPMSLIGRSLWSGRIEASTGAAVGQDGGMTEAVIRWGAWYEDRDLRLAFPDGWDVEVCPPQDGPDIGDSGIAAAFAEPIGTPPLRQLAQGKTSPCIVIDDLSRPTPGDRLVPRILDELAAAGIPAEDVLVLAGTANHRTMTGEDLRKKLGDDVLARCRVAMHFSWDN